jgi:hypothetical protein
VCDDAPDLAAQIKRRWDPEAIEQRAQALENTAIVGSVRVVKQGREGNGESLGQLGGASLSNLPRASSRGGVNAKPGCNLSKNTTSCQNGIVSQRTNANEALRGVDFPASHNRAVERGGVRRGVHRAGLSYFFVFGPEGEAHSARPRPAHLNLCEKDMW